MSNTPAPPGPITAVTFTAPDLSEVTSLYAEFLDYRVVSDGHVSEDQAKAWDAPATAGLPLLELAPAVGDDFLFRVVEAPASDYLPFASYGWNAAEIIVNDVDALAARLDGSPFEIVGEPQDLSKGNPELAAEMRRRLHEWREQSGAAMPRPRPD